MNDLVEKINQANWTNAHAGDARKWLLELLSDERDVCLRAYHKLEIFLVSRNAPPEDYAALSEIFEYEGVVLIISFLLDILTVNHGAGKEFALELIYDIARNINLNIDETGAYMERVLRVKTMILESRFLFLILSGHPQRQIRMFAKLVLETIDTPIEEWGQYNWEAE